MENNFFEKGIAVMTTYGKKQKYQLEPAKAVGDAKGIGIR